MCAIQLNKLKRIEYSHNDMKLVRFAACYYVHIGKLLLMKKKKHIPNVQHGRIDE